MTNKIKYSLILMLVIFSIALKAQQSSLLNTYALDPLQLNIAYAASNCKEVNIHYRSQWIGMKETLKTMQLNAHTSFGKTSGIAIKVSSQSYGLLKNTNATLGYGYNIKLKEDQHVHLGVGIGWSQASLSSQNATVIDLNDVTLDDNNRQTANGFDSEFGAMFVGKKLKGGIGVLHLYNNNPDFTGGNGYKALPQFNTHVSYIFNEGKKIEIEPILLNRYTLKGDNVIDGIVNLNLNKMYLVGAGYRTNYGVLLLLGMKYNNIKFCYSVDYGVGKKNISLGTSHQVMLGYGVCTKGKTSTKRIKSKPQVIPNKF